MDEEIKCFEKKFQPYKTYCIKSCKSLHLKSAFNQGNIPPNSTILLIYLSLVTLT